MNPSESTAPSTPEQSTKKKDVQIGRIIVRAFISGLLIVMAVEIFAYGRLLYVHHQLSAELQKSEKENHRITKEIVGKILGGRVPDESKNIKVFVGEERYDIYYFWGLLKQRPLCVRYGVAGMQSEPEVVEITTIIPDEVLAKQ